MTALGVRDYDPESGELRVRSGNGNRERLVYVTNGAADALAAWLKVRGLAARPLYVPVTKDGTLLMHRMTEQGLHMILRRRRDEAKVEELSPHDLRSTFISTLLDQGIDLVTVQGLAGHASIATTAMYDRRGETAKRRAAETLKATYGSR